MFCPRFAHPPGKARQRASVERQELRRRGETASQRARLVIAASAGFSFSTCVSVGIGDYICLRREHVPGTCSTCCASRGITLFLECFLRLCTYEVYTGLTSSLARLCPRSVAVSVRGRFWLPSNIPQRRYTRIALAQNSGCPCEVNIPFGERINQPTKILEEANKNRYARKRVCPTLSQGNVAFRAQQQQRYNSSGTVH